MIRKSKHTTQVPGVEELMQRIDGVQGVVKVKDRGIRTSRVSPRRREPEVMAAINRVVVTHYCGGSLQRIDVYPQRCVPVTVLKDRILAMLEHERQRGGVGMSSKAEIPIPERIRKLQRVACVPLAAASISPPAVGTIVTLVSEPLHAEDTVGSSNTPPPAPAPEIINLSAKQAEIYEFILGLDPTGQLEFVVEGIYSRTVQAFNQKASTCVTALKQKGLIEQARGPGADNKKWFTVRRCPYQIVKVGSHGPVTVKKPLAPARDTADETLDHFQWLEKHWSLIAEAEQRQKVLARRGYEVVEIKGRLALAKTSK